MGVFISFEPLVDEANVTLCYVTRRVKVPYNKIDHVDEISSSHVEPIGVILCPCRVDVKLFKKTLTSRGVSRSFRVNH